MHFLSLRGNPICLSISIANECGDKRSLQEYFSVYCFIMIMRKYGACSKFKATSLNKDRVKYCF